MYQEHDNRKRRAWKQLSEAEQYKIEALRRAGHRAAEIGAQLGRDRRTIERELIQGSVLQRRENKYVSRNPSVPDYLEERRYLADAGQRVKEKRAANKDRPLKIGRAHDLVDYIEKKIIE